MQDTDYNLLSSEDYVSVMELSRLEKRYLYSLCDQRPPW